MIRLYVAEQLDIDIEDVNKRLDELGAVLPDVIGSLERLKADVVLELVRDVEKVAQRMVELKDLLLGVDVSRMVVGNVWLLHGPPLEILQHNVQNLRQVWTR